MLVSYSEGDIFTIDAYKKQKCQGEKLRKYTSLKRVPVHGIKQMVGDHYWYIGKTVLTKCFLDSKCTRWMEWMQLPEFEHAHVIL